MLPSPMKALADHAARGAKRLDDVMGARLEGDVIVLSDSEAPRAQAAAPKKKLAAPSGASQGVRRANSTQRPPERTEDVQARTRETPSSAREEMSVQKPAKKPRPTPIHNPKPTGPAPGKAKDAHDLPSKAANRAGAVQPARMRPVDAPHATAASSREALLDRKDARGRADGRASAAAPSRPSAGPTRQPVIIPPSIVAAVLSLGGGPGGKEKAADRRTVGKCTGLRVCSFAERQSPDRGSQSIGKSSL